MRGNHKGSAMGRVPPSNTQSWHNQPLLTSPLITKVRPSDPLDITTTAIRGRFSSMEMIFPIKEQPRCLAILFTDYFLWFQVLRKAPGPSLSGKYHPSNWCRGFRRGVILLECDCTHNFNRDSFPSSFRRNIKFHSFVRASLYSWIIARSSVCHSSFKFLASRFFVVDPWTKLWLAEIFLE